MWRSSTRNPPLDVAAFLAPSEITALRPLPDRDRPAALVSRLDAKESYIKTIGTGLARDLRRIAFTLDPTGLGPGGEAPDDWQFFQIWPTPRHVLAVALHRKACEPATVVRRAVEHDEL